MLKTFSNNFATISIRGDNILFNQVNINISMFFKISHNIYGRYDHQTPNKQVLLLCFHDEVSG